MIYATTVTEVETRHKAFVRKWRLKCTAVATSQLPAIYAAAGMTAPSPSAAWGMIGITPLIGCVNNYKAQDPTLNGAMLDEYFSVTDASKLESWAEAQGLEMPAVQGIEQPRHQRQPRALTVQVVVQDVLAHARDPTRRSSRRSRAALLRLRRSHGSPARCRGCE